MARKPRIHIPGGLYHVMLRGNGGQDIFLSPEDHYRMFFLIQEGVERFGHRILPDGQPHPPGNTSVRGSSFQSRGQA